LTPALKEGGSIHLRKYRWLSLRNVLVLAQTSASLSLLILTGYMGLGIQSTLGMQEGFQPRNLYLISLDPVRDGYPAPRAAAFLDGVLERVRGLTSVSAACLTDTVPVAIDGNPGVRFSTTGTEGGSLEELHWARRHTVGHGYFEAAGIPILAGRGFRKEDEADGTTAVVVSERLVREVWNRVDPVGQRIAVSNDRASGSFGGWPGTFDLRAEMIGKSRRTHQVIGVVGDVTEDVAASKKHPAVYFPLHSADYSQPSLRGVTLMVRGLPGADVIRAVRNEVAAMNASVTPFNARSMLEQIAQFMLALKAASWTDAMIGVFGLILASVGLAGVTAYAVAQRGHEIGIRLALGAQKRDVLRLVMREGAVLVTAGSVLGLAFAWAGVRALSGLFFSVASVEGSDPLLLGGGPLLLAALALAGCYVPARRSTRIDPAIALRRE
jgi:putative ABC transport system permease protein